MRCCSRLYNTAISDRISPSQSLILRFPSDRTARTQTPEYSADLAERYNTIKSEYDKISEQIESKKAQRELFKVFIRALEKQGALLEEFDEGLWSSLVQEVVVNAKDDIRFIFKNGFEIKTR